MVSPWTSPFAVQAHDDSVHAWCAWLPWISRSVCAIRRPCWRTAWRHWKCSIYWYGRFLPQCAWRAPQWSPGWCPRWPTGCPRHTSWPGAAGTGSPQTPPFHACSSGPGGREERGKVEERKEHKVWGCKKEKKEGRAESRQAWMDGNNRKEMKEADQKWRKWIKDARSDERREVAKKRKVESYAI